VDEGRLRELKGVGEALEDKITQFVREGKINLLEEYREKFPDTIQELFSIPGFGPKRIKQVYDELGVDSLSSLKDACEKGKVAELKGFSDKLQQKLVDGIEYVEQFAGQFRINVALKAADALLAYLKEDKSVIRIEVAGSLRRRKEVVKDIDILASSRKPEQLMDRFVNAPNVASVSGHGKTKSSVVLDSGIAADLRVVEDDQFPFALHYFTGSKEHNVELRRRAKERDLKLNEYGLFRDDDSLVACKTEEDLFKQFDLPYIPPPLREDRGELDETPPKDLITEDGLVGLFHCHTTYSDGKNTLEEMVEACQERDYEYMLITDHSQSAAYAGGLKPDRIAEQHEEIDKLSKKLKKFKILKGIESDILAKGDLDYEEGVLKSFDLIIASVHSGLDMTEAQATKRLVTAVENPYTRILGHPTARLLLQRDGYALDMEKIYDACLANNVAVEINANPRRLDVDWRHIKFGRDKGVKFVIGPDAHVVKGIDDVKYGVGIAQKGWLTPAHLLNCMSHKELMAWRNSS